MKLAIIGDVEEGKEGAALRIIDTFVSDHKGGGGAVMSAGSGRLSSLTDKYAREKGYSSIIMYNATHLAVLNADKVLVLHTKKYDMEEVVDMCKKYEKPFMEIK